jgi:hypothetical protein
MNVLEKVKPLAALELKVRDRYSGVNSNYIRSDIQRCSYCGNVCLTTWVQKPNASRFEGWDLCHSHLHLIINILSKEDDK